MKMSKTSLCITCSVCMLLAPALGRTETEEQRLIRIAPKLKPISDSQWNEIATSKIADIYDVQSKDNLWSISKRLFGNAFYWPKVWAINNKITNPHRIEPGLKLSFTSGSSGALPQITPAHTSTDQPSVDSGSATTSTDSGSGNAPSSSGIANSGEKEYTKVPKEWWTTEDILKDFNKNYDDYGLDKDLKITIPSRFVFRVPAIANGSTVPFLGEITGSRRDGVGLSQNETVFVRSNSQDLQVGTTYSIFDEAEYFNERRSDRTGYIYSSTGEVRIIGVKDGLYIGTITAAYDVIRRGQRLYPLLPLVSEVKPLAAESEVEAVVVNSTRQSIANGAQFRTVHFDRGLQDGVQIGNVFRLYEYDDPATEKKITDSDFLINADALVIHVTAEYSTAIILRSRSTFKRGDFGVLLTDVADLERQIRERSHSFGEESSTHSAQEDAELDELDELDRAAGEGLGTKEAVEIKELDHWDKTKDQHLDNEENGKPSAVESSGEGSLDALPLNEATPSAPEVLDVKPGEPQPLPDAPAPPAAPPGLEPIPSETAHEAQSTPEQNLDPVVPSNPESAPEGLNEPPALDR